MARKNLLAGLSAAELPAGNSPQPGSPSIASAARGAIGAVSRSIEQIRAQGVAELAPDLIDSSFIQDRLGGSDDEIASLVESMREHGQQVPILVRPHPEADGRYQVAYGRRRLRAAVALGRPVRAIVRTLSDEQLVVAQGQENIERKDLSFIERALFAAQLEAHGFTRETIMAALGVDKTGLSRLISSATRIPEDVIQAIGPAPKTGRDRWSELALQLESMGAIERVRLVIADGGFASRASDERFGLALRAAAAKPRKAPRKTVLKAADGRKFAEVKSDLDRVSVIFDKKRQAAFTSYLLQELPALYARFVERTET